jgi:hypothetical protein
MTIKLQHIAKISACLGSGHSESMIWGVWTNGWLKINWTLWSEIIQQKKN